MPEAYPYLTALVIILGFIANACAERIIDFKATSRRYLPPQRLTTSRYRMMCQRIREFEAWQLKQMEQPRWASYAA